MTSIWNEITGGYADNWKLHLGLAGLVGVAGGVAALWTLLVFGPQVRAQLPAGSFVVVATLGASIAGLFLGPFMGQRGLMRTALSLAAFFGATVMGAFVAGAIGLSGQALELVLLWLVMHLATPALALWLGLWGAVHWAGIWVRNLGGAV